MITSVPSLFSSPLLCNEFDGDEGKGGSLREKRNTAGSLLKYVLLMGLLIFGASFFGRVVERNYGIFHFHRSVGSELTGVFYKILLLS